MRRRFAVLDVFTNTPLAGNPLAVVLDSEGLDDRRMQAVAREFNLSETVFVLPADNPVHSAKIRIFTPTRELRFAGHPTVGTAVLLAHRNGQASEGEHDAMLILEEKVGPVRCGVVVRDGVGRAVFDLPKIPVEAGQGPDIGAAAAALGLTRSEIGFENHLPSFFDAGTPYRFVPVRNLAAMAKVEPQPGLWEAAFPNKAGAYLYTRETEAVGRQFHARMFVPEVGIIEDPATGGAAAAFAGVINKFDATSSGWRTVIIEQGFEMGRPSLVTLEMEVETGQLKQARIAGDAVIVAEGELNID